MALDIVRRFVNGAWKTEAAETGGGGGLPVGGTTGQVLTKESNADGDAGWENGGSLPAHWSIDGSSPNDSLISTSEFDFGKADQSRVTMVKGHQDLLDVVSRQGNEMLGVGETDVHVTVGDGNGTPGSLDLIANSFSDQGTTSPLLLAGSSGGMSVFRSGQTKISPSFDGDDLPALEVVGTFGGTQPAARITSAPGGAVLVNDALGNPCFRIDADGTVHIKTGGSIVADL